MVSEKIKSAVEKEYKITCKECFAHWISCLWFKYEGFSFEENKEAFFWLLEKLLKEGKVRFCSPEDPLYREKKEWDATPEEVIVYLKERWPEDAKDENDGDLHIYFYQIPAIAWLGEDGKWYSS